MTEYAEQEMRDTITSTASTLCIPHTPAQQNKAFHLLLKGITFWQTNPATFIQNPVDNNSTLTRAPLSMQDVIQAPHTIYVYLHQETSQQLHVFDPPKKSL